MAANSKIEWTDHAFNPWTGCTRVSPGCDHCYAATMAKRNPAAFGSWEPGAPRKRTSAANWQQPLAWNAKAVREGRRARVFCASMADVFDNQVPEDWRQDLWALILDTPHLDWLLLTKRPQNIAKMLPGSWSDGWPNVWLGTTVENQAEADRRIPELLAVPAAKRFLSCEPLLGPVDLERPMPGPDLDQGGGAKICQPWMIQSGIDWVIAGGESGPGARPMHPDWARSLRDQCAAAGAPFFFKQWGEWLGGSWSGHEELLNFKDTAGQLIDLGGPLSSPARWDGKLRHWGECLWEGPGALRIGKARAGRLLDGVQHDGVPA